MSSRKPLLGALISGAVLVLAACTLLNASPAQARGDAPHPLVIGHRGASGYLPEHTLEGYALAIELGADYIEPDLVATRDGVLVARHEPNIINTTNVKDLPRFAGRKRKAMVDGVEEEGYFVSDFTLAELKTLGAVQAFPDRDQSFNGRFRIPTFDEVIELAQRKSREVGRPIGVYPETKHPTYHRALGLPLEDRLLQALTRHGWNHRNAPVFIQSFEPGSLKYLRARTSVRLVQLVDADDVNLDGSIALNKPYDRPYDWAVAGDPRLFKDMLTPAGLAEVRTYADGIGPWKVYLMSSAGTDRNGDGKADDINGDGLVNEADRRLLPPTDVVANAHRLGLLVHPYTFRNEAKRLASNYQGNPVNEFLAFYELGVDGLFTDFADTAVAARAMFRLKRDPDYARCLTGAAPGRSCERD